MDENGKAWHGYFNHKKKTYLAHRVAYELSTDTLLPNDVLVRHRCDNPACCNPQHLETGTSQDNMRDRDLRGRTLRGVAHGMAKVSERIVRELRCLYAQSGAKVGAIQALADRYQLHKKHVRDIVRRHTWKHIPDDFTSLEQLVPLPENLVKPRPNNHGGSALTIEHVREIRAKHATGTRQKDLCVEYGLTAGPMSALINQKTWRGI